MARKYPKRYHEYRGRRKRGNLVLKIIIALLALILLACLVFLVFLGGRVEYTDEGVRIVMPWSEQEPDVSEEPTPSDVVTPPVIVIDPEEPSEEPEPSPEPEPEPEPRPETIGAVEVTVADLLNGTAAQLVADAGGDTLVVEMKTSDGSIQWNSAAALPGQASENGAAVAEAVQTLAEQGELYLVARVSCFRDEAMAETQAGTALMTKGGNVWYDLHGFGWVSPASETVRTYLINLCLELADMGFDEILLEYAGYPYFGETHVLATGDLRPEDLSQPVGRFWQELKTALTAENVSLSVLVTEEMAEGTEAYSGITPELMAQHADRVWVYVPLDSTPVSPLIADRLVYVGGSETNGSWASMAPTEG